MNKFKIGIIGCGKLGAPCGNVFAEAGHDVIGLDPNPNPEVRFPMVSGMMELLKDRDIVFIAVPTPHAEEYGGEKPTSHLPSRGFDISIVDSVFKEIHAAGSELNLGKWPTIALISTVLPGTCRNELNLEQYPFDVVYNPYLIAMGSVEWDMKNPDLIIFGTKTGQFPEVVFDEDGKLVLDDPVCKLMVLYDQLIENHDTFDNGTLHYSKWTLGTWEEAEATKIYYNTFISAKIAFVNMIQDTAMAVGNMNVDVVTNNIFLSEKRILSTAYTKAGMGDAGACLHPETLIFTDSGLKAIKDVIVGDRVIGEDGKLHDVTKVYVNKHSSSGEDFSGEIVKLKVESAAPVFLTEDHEVYASKDTRSRYVTGGKTRYSNDKNVAISTQVTKTDKVSVKNLEINNFYVIDPIVRENISIPDYATTEYIELAGYYLSEGTVEKGRTGRPTRISFYLHRNEENTLAENIQFLLKTMYPDKKVSISYRGQKGLSVRTNNPELASRLMEDFGHLCYNKFIPSWILLNGDTRILKGIFQGDGHSSKTGFALSTTSRKLAVGVSSILKTVGIYSSVQYHKPRTGKNDGVRHRESFEVRISNGIWVDQMSQIIDMPTYHKKQDKKYNERIFAVDDKVYRRVKAKEYVPYNGPVYDLEVTDVHNYLTEFGLVSNCHPRDGIALSSFAKEYVLCYDFFGNLNNVREQQAKNLAFFLADQARAHNLPVIIHGKTYKPGVTYTDGSYSLLVGHYVEQITGEKPIYVDPLTGDTVESMLGVILMAHSAPTTYSHTVTIGSPEQRLYAPIEPGSVIIDIWRELNPEALPGCTIIQYGNTRQGEFIRPSQD